MASTTALQAETAKCDGQPNPAPLAGAGVIEQPVEDVQSSNSGTGAKLGDPNQQPARLTDLPDEILLLALPHLDSARDLGSLGLSCRRLHRVVREDGWRVFVRTHFPSLTVSVTEAADWKRVAESLAWQSRCWDKRSIVFEAYLAKNENARGHAFRQSPRTSFHPVIDAHLDIGKHQEVVVWGAGEHIVARYRQRQGWSRTTMDEWHRVDGLLSGYAAGRDDVNALKLVEDPAGNVGTLGMMVGRANGQLSLLSAEPDTFGAIVKEFRPLPRDENAESSSGVPRVLEAGGIKSIDILDRVGPEPKLVAATTKDDVLLYPLPDTKDDTSIGAPSAVYNIRQHSSESRDAIGCAKWMGSGDILALGLSFSRKDPLRFLSLTPDGRFTTYSCAKNPRFQEAGLSYRSFAPESMEPIKAMGPQMLLSSWIDGTVRLQDLRTPSPCDAVYQDNVDPWPVLNSLITYGTERFVAGGMYSSALKVFDFRWPKDYYHTTGLPCGNHAPFPQPPQPFMRQPALDTVDPLRCDYATGERCKWHRLSRSLYYRPNASFFFAKSLPQERRQTFVWSLAKAADISPYFYVGLPGGVVEASLQPSESVRGDPNFGFGDIGASGHVELGYQAKTLTSTMMELGDGAMAANQSNIRLPSVHGLRLDRKASGMAKETSFITDELRSKHRLDRRFQQEPADFEHWQ